MDTAMTVGVIQTRGRKLGVGAWPIEVGGTTTTGIIFIPTATVGTMATALGKLIKII
jgi:hypothetical protein